MILRIEQGGAERRSVDRQYRSLADSHVQLLDIPGVEELFDVAYNYYH